MSYILLYIEIDKFFSEDESGVLEILNKLRVGYFKDSDNELAKTLTYLIYGQDKKIKVQGKNNLCTFHIK